MAVVDLEGGFRGPEPALEIIIIIDRRKQAKYANLSQGYSFTPVAIETLGAIGPKSLAFLKDLGRRIFQQSGESKATPYLLQRISVAVQQGNSAAIDHGYYGLLVSCVCPLFSSFSLFLLK